MVATFVVVTFAYWQGSSDSEAALSHEKHMRSALNHEKHMRAKAEQEAAFYRKELDASNRRQKDLIRRMDQTIQSNDLALKNMDRTIEVLDSK